MHWLTETKKASIKTQKASEINGSFFYVQNSRKRNCFLFNKKSMKLNLINFMHLKYIQNLLTTKK
jgi:hypothetical protein